MSTDHRTLEVAAGHANVFLKMALVHYTGTRSGEETAAAEATKSEWRKRLKADPTLRPSTALEHATDEAVVAEREHRVARVEFDAELERQRQERAARLHPGAPAI